ncbi:JAB domain-containing protein [Mongoliitalea lutea]|uniref:DNA repair protein RadC n=1 Tax=Mongoliitalea lutea TaxID=849756 RepID=A0A8J3D0Q4_9BACT|nr:DNA repair protein RadC [Mongoliitalea lutea]GHB44362.1 DNA repair protein RadC [Mongoliitalea lutea]
MKLREPIEKMLLRGKSALTDAELIAISAGIPIETAREILIYVNFNLQEIPRLSIGTLKKFKGISESKAVAIVSAFELGRRRSLINESPKRFKIFSSADIYQYMKPDLLDEVVEYFYVILLNRQNYVIKKVMISQGGTAGTVADPKLIFKHALESLANSIVLVHNHPSGNVKPSEQDRRLTNKIIEVGKSLECPVLDHMIFTDCAYFSFADEGLI